MRYQPNTIETIPNKVVKTESGCWEWQGYRRKDGYRVTSHKGKATLVHRLVYTLFVGEIPPGLCLDHLCRNRACCNPEHLEPVTHQVNTTRGETGLWEKLLTHCRQGHEYTPENTYTDKVNQRHCKTCNKERQRILRKNRKEGYERKTA